MIIKNQKIINTKVLYIALLLNVISYISLYFLYDFRSEILNYFLTLIPAYTGYFIIVYYSLKFKTSTKNDLILILIIGLIIRLFLIPSTPVLSDDVYRYLWDGKVFAHGINPYLFAPNSPALSSLQDTIYYTNINHPGVPASYPPAAQLFFLINYWIGNQVLIWKIILLIVEMISVLFMVKLIDYFSMNRLRLAIYYLNPLVIIETYSSGHFEVIGICFLIIALYYFYQNKSFKFLTATIMAILVKFIPFIIILPFLKNKFWNKVLTIVGVVIIVLLIFSLDGAMPIAGIISYTNRWEFNGALYKAFTSIINFLGVVDKEWISLTYSGRVETIYITSAFYYKIMAFIAMLVILVDQMKKLKMTASFRGINYFQASFFVCATLLLLSPTLYPWYLIWLIPFLIFLPNWSWLFFTMLIQLSYYVLQNYHTNGVWEESNVILFLQYFPFYGLLIFEYLDKRKIKGWFL